MKMMVPVIGQERFYMRQIKVHHITLHAHIIEIWVHLVLEVLQKFHQLDKMMDIYGRLILISIILNVMAWYFGLVYQKVKRRQDQFVLQLQMSMAEKQHHLVLEMVETNHYQECGILLVVLHQVHIISDKVILWIEVSSITIQLIIFII